MDYHGLSWTIMDFYGLLWTIMDYHGLLWTIMDYHVSFFANIDSISTTLSSISTTLIFNLMTVYPQLFQYIHNLAQYIHNFNSVYPQPRSLLLSRCRDWKQTIWRHSFVFVPLVHNFDPSIFTFFWISYKYFVICSLFLRTFFCNYSKSLKDLNYLSGYKWQI